MKRYLLTLCGISLAALLSCPAAFADTFNFSFSGTQGPGFTGMGTFTTTATGTSGQFLINNITGGTTNGVAIAGVLAPNTYPPVPAGDFSNDNILYFPLVSGGALDLNGFSYDTTDGTDYNIYYYDGTYDVVTDPNLDAYLLTSFTITDTTTGTTIVSSGPTPALAPEPGSLLLLATGALGVAGTMRRRLRV